MECAHNSTNIFGKLSYSGAQIFHVCTTVAITYSCSVDTFKYCSARVALSTEFPFNKHKRAKQSDPYEGFKQFLFSSPRFDMNMSQIKTFTVQHVSN